MAIQEINCDSWSAFKSETLRDVFGSAMAMRGRFYFRGHGSSSWPLMSTFDRWYAAAKPNGKSKTDAARQFISLFKDEASRLTPDPGLTNDADELLALAQHYGVPTRLLDWTESPYVAAFFAFSGIASTPNATNKIAIWCLDTTNGIWREDTGIKLLSVAAPFNERLKNQLGKFTLLQSPFNTVEEHIAKVDTYGTVLTKIMMPATEALQALSDLDFMGINHSTITPGLIGCARAARLRMLLANSP